MSVAWSLLIVTVGLFCILFFDSFRLMPNLNLFGVPRLTSSNEPLQLSLPALLLIYLSLRNDWVSRTELAYLFRPDAADSKAKKYLRQLLHRAKGLGWAGEIELKDGLVRFVLSSDASCFKQAVNEAAWHEAIPMYSGDLLASYAHPELETFNAWLELERSSFREEFKFALKKQAVLLETSGEFDEAARFLERYLELDGLAEEVLCDFLKLMIQLNHREKGLGVYKAFCEQLKTEFDLEPLDETKALAEALKTGSTKSEPVTSVAVPHNLPSQATRFVGRKQDIEVLTTKLGQANCRVLSLVGLGGAGKTRLSFEVARLVLPEFSDGVFFIALSSVTTREALLSTVAHTLGIHLSSREDAETELFSALKEKNMLLVLDNVEQLSVTPEFVTAILLNTDHLKILVTSRISLDLNSEWVYDVQGLPFPKSFEGDLLSFDAVKLFLEAANRVKPAMVLQESDAQLVAKICQSVEGLPLALELAARWHRLLSFKEIQEELSTGISLLESEQADIPERQSSMRFVFEQTWQSLSEQQQKALAVLSLFQDGFSKEAAKTVAGSHFALLLSLLNRGLVRKQKNNRFDMHELLRQYAYGKLEQQVGVDSIKRAHLDYYLAFTKNAGLRITEKDGEQLINALTSERENIFSALEYALSLEDATDSQALMAGIWFFLHQKGFWLEALHYLKAVYAKNGPASEDKANVLTGFAALNIVLAKFQEGERYALEAIELGETLGLNRIVQSNSGNLAVLFQKQGDYEKAYTYTLKAYQMSLKTGRNTDIHLNNLGTNNILRENFTQAKDYLLEALTIIRDKGLHNSLAMCLGNLVIIELHLGQLDEAERYAKEILTLDASNNLHISNHSRLSQIYAQKLELSKAQEHANIALVLSEKPCEVSKRIGALQASSQVAFLQKNYTLAKDYIYRALQLQKERQLYESMVETQAHAASVEFALGNRVAALQQLKAALKQFKTRKPQLPFLAILYSVLKMMDKQDSQVAYQLIQAIKQIHKDKNIIATSLVKRQLQESQNFISNSELKGVTIMSVNQTIDHLTAWIHKNLKLTES